MCDIYHPSNVGKQLVAFDVQFTGSPAFRAITCPTDDAADLAKRLSQGIRHVITEILGDDWERMGYDDGPLVVVHPQTGIIESAEERAASFAKFHEDVHESAEKGKAAWNEILANHPNNGTLGWWSVENYRRTTIVKASSAKEAVDKAELSGAHSIDWIGTELPDVIEC